MKLFLWKIGKVWNMLRRNGLRSGLRVVSRYTLIFFRSFFVKSGDILFISGGVGDSAFYRSINPVEELTLHGFKCSTTVLDNPFLPRYADRFKIFILHRTPLTNNLSRLIKKVKEKKKELIFDTDDLVYDPEYLHLMDYYKKMTAWERDVYKNGIGGEIIGDPYVKICTTSTSYLAKKLEEKEKKVFIVKNKISLGEMAIAEKIRERGKLEKSEDIYLGYFSGTSSHNKDFATINEALDLILEKYPQVKLCLAGPLETGNRLSKYEERIITLPFVVREKYYENLFLADINLAPLELNNPFCEAKSEIKFTEPGILGIPTVAVRNQTFSEAIEDGVNGFLADNTEEWVNKLSQLIEDQSLRKKIGEKAREKVLRDYTNKNSHNEEWYQYLRQVLSKIK